jgi:tetratricopeptide (TPR) repeat protein
MEFSKRNEIDSAYFYINEGLSRDSNDPELLTLKGDLLIRMGENNRAINCYYTAYKVDSTYINAYVGLLKYHIENYVSQDSLEYYMTKIILTDETNPYPYLFLAGYLSELKLYEVAKTYYNLSFVLDSLNTDMWNGLGDVYFQLNQNDTARALYDYSLLIDSNYALTYNRIGNLEYNENNLEGAIASYLKAYEINPWESVYTKGLGSFYYESKDYSNSLKYYLLYLNQYSVDASVYLDIVHCYIHLMDIDSAIKYFKIGIENNYWIDTRNENNELKKLYIRSGENFYYENLKKDKELKILKKNKEFKEIMKSISTAL